MSKEMKIKISKFINIMFVIVAIGLVGGTAAIFIGSEMNAEWALSVRQYLLDNYGFTVSAGTITAVVAVLKTVLSIRNDNQATVDRVDAALYEMKKLKDEVINSNKETKESVTKEVSQFNKNMTSLQAQPEKINNIAGLMSEIAEQNSINFSLLDLFMYKNTNDQEIKDICSNYKQSKLMQNSLLQEKIKSMLDIDPNDGKESLAEKVITHAPKVLKTVSKAIKDGNQIVKKIEG